MSEILDDLAMGSRMRNEVCDDVCDEQIFGRAKVVGEEVSHCDDGAPGRHAGDQFDRECFAEFEPGLVEPALGRGGFSSGEQLGGVSRKPCGLAFRARQMRFGHVKENLHLLAA